MNTTTNDKSNMVMATTQESTLENQAKEFEPANIKYVESIFTDDYRIEDLKLILDANTGYKYELFENESGASWVRCVKKKNTSTKFDILLENVIKGNKVFRKMHGYANFPDNMIDVLGEYLALLRTAGKYTVKVEKKFASNKLFMLMVDTIKNVGIDGFNIVEHDDKLYLRKGFVIQNLNTTPKKIKSWAEDLYKLCIIAERDKNELTKLKDIHKTGKRERVYAFKKEVFKNVQNSTNTREYTCSITDEIKLLNKENIIPWYGGKFAWVDCLVRLILKAQRTCNADTYIEPYLGGGKCFYNLPNNVFQKYILNELYINLFTLWKVLLKRDATVEMISYAKNISVSKESFKNSLDMIENDSCINEIQRAAHTYHVIMNSRDSAMNSYSIDERYIKHCDKLIEKRSKFPVGEVNLSNMDALGLIKKHMINPKAVIFLDPPYLVDELVATSVYKEKEAVKTEHHTQLIDLLCSESCKAKVILCGYYRQTEKTKNGVHLYDKLLKHGFQILKFPERAKPSSKNAAKATEYIWLNF